MQYKISTHFEKIKARVLWEAEVHPEELVCYSFATCWWCILRDNPYKIRGTHGLPCDPRGAVLYQGPIKEFIDAAVNGDHNHYGKHGLQAFWSSYHGVVLRQDHTMLASTVLTGKAKFSSDWKPWAFKGWDEYNKVLDEHFKNQTETEKRLAEQEEKLRDLNQQLTPEMKQKMLDDLIKELNDG